MNERRFERQHHREQFLELLPPPGRMTIDVGCGEEGLSRDLKAREYTGFRSSCTSGRRARRL